MFVCINLTATLNRTPLHTQILSKQFYDNMQQPPNIFENENIFTTNLMNKKITTQQGTEPNPTKFIPYSEPVKQEQQLNLQIRSNIAHRTLIQQLEECWMMIERLLVQCSNRPFHHYVLEKILSAYFRTGTKHYIRVVTQSNQSLANRTEKELPGVGVVDILWVPGSYERRSASQCFIGKPNHQQNFQDYFSTIEKTLA